MRPAVQNLRSGEPELLSTAVIEAIAEHEGVPPTELDPPLFQTIDLDGLDSLFSGRADSTNGEVVFDYDGSEVRVGADGEVRVSRDRQA